MGLGANNEEVLSYEEAKNMGLLPNQNKERSGLYCILPSAILEDKNLAPRAMILLSFINGMCTEKGYCWASNGYLSGVLGVKPNQVSQLITQLRDNGYITTTMIREERSNAIKERVIMLMPKAVGMFKLGTQRSEVGTQRSDESYSSEAKGVLSGGKRDNKYILKDKDNISSPRNNKTEPFKPDLKFVTDVCVQNNFRGMNETPEQMAEWFCKVATEPDGTLNYRGRKIGNVASLVAVLRSADVSGKSFASARRGGHTNARGEDFDASGYWKRMGYGDD